MFAERQLSDEDEPANDFYACSRPWNKINGSLSSFLFFFFLSRRIIPTSKTEWCCESSFGSSRSSPKGNLCSRAAKEGGEEDRILRRRLASPDARVPPSFPVVRLARLIAMLVTTPAPGIWKRNHILCLPLTDRSPFYLLHLTRPIVRNEPTAWNYDFRYLLWVSITRSGRATRFGRSKRNRSATRGDTHGFYWNMNFALRNRDIRDYRFA